MTCLGVELIPVYWERPSPSPSAGEMEDEMNKEMHSAHTAETPSGACEREAKGFRLCFNGDVQIVQE